MKKKKRLYSDEVYNARAYFSDACDITAMCFPNAVHDNSQKKPRPIGRKVWKENYALALTGHRDTNREEYL